MLMKIPSSIRISGVEYNVSYVPYLNNGQDLAYGHIDYENCVIELSATHGTAHEKRCLIMWHEIIHGLCESFGLTIGDDENVVDTLARGIYQVLQDNGARFFDIVSDSDAP